MRIALPSDVRSRAVPAVPSIALAVGMLACGDEPAAEAEHGYHRELQPLIVDNAKMAKDFQVLAARIKKDSPGATDVGKRLDRQFIPSAQNLADRARAIDPATPELAGAHELLVASWDARVEHYEGVREAWKAQDLDAFQAAVDAGYTARTLEERYFREVNIALAPAALTLQPYP